jgi:hypothetical protein
MAYATRADIEWVITRLHEFDTDAYLWHEGNLKDFNLIKGNLNEIKDTLRKDLENNAAVGQATLLSSTVNGLANGLTNAVKGFQSGDTLAGTAGLMTTFGAITPLLSLAGPLGTIAGAILSSVFEIANIILGAVRPPQRSMLDDIKELLKETHAKDLVNTLNGITRQFKRVESDFNAGGPARTWESILQVENFDTGYDDSEVEAVISWLGDEENQKLDVWSLVFTAHTHVMNLHLLNLWRAKGLVHKHLENMALAKSKAEEAAKDQSANDPTLAYHKAEAAIKAAGAYEAAMSSWNRALAAAKIIYEQHDLFFEEITAVAVNKGSVWHIGDNRKLFARKQVVSSADWKPVGGESEEIAVCSVGNRIWAQEGSKSGSVWTTLGPGAKWNKLSLAQKVNDIWVVPQPTEKEPQRSLVFWVSGNSINYLSWNEGLKEDVRNGDRSWIKSSGNVSTAGGPGPELSKVRVTKAGDVYLLTNSSPAKLYRTSINELSRGIGNKSKFEEITFSGLLPAPKGISATRERLYIYNDDRIWYQTHDGLRPSKGFGTRHYWHEMNGPQSNEDFVMPKQWKYEHVFATDEGAVLAIIDKKIYSWFEGTWTKNEDADAVRVFKLPIEGWDEFSPLRNNMKEYLKSLKEPKAGTAAASTAR